MVVVSVIKGVFIDLREFDIKFINLDVNEFLIDDSMIIKFVDVGSDVEVVRGFNIKFFFFNIELS